MLLTMEEIKAQLRLDEDFDADNRHLQLLACAAQKRTETYLNRKLYAPDETIPDSDPDGLHLPDDIRLGMLMLISHFYENRSSVTDVEKMELPMSFNWLVGPYRLQPYTRCTGISIILPEICCRTCVMKTGCTGTPESNAACEKMR